MDFEVRQVYYSYGKTVALDGLSFSANRGKIVGLIGENGADPDTGCMEFEIRKGRFSFRLTAPYSEERRRTASEAAKKCGVHRKVAHLHGDSN